MDPCKIPKTSYGHKHRVIHFHFYTKKPRYPFLSFPPPLSLYLENPVFWGQLAATCYQSWDWQTARMSCWLLSGQSYLWFVSWWRCWRSRMVCCCWRWPEEPRPQVCELTAVAAGGAEVWPEVCKLDQAEARPSSALPWVLRQTDWRCSPAASPALQTCRPLICVPPVINPLGSPPGRSRPRVWPLPGATISLMRVWWLSWCHTALMSRLASGVSWDQLSLPASQPPPVSLSSPGSTLGKYADLQLQHRSPPQTRTYSSGAVEHCSHHTASSESRSVSHQIKIEGCQAGRRPHQTE